MIIAILRQLPCGLLFFIAGLTFGWHMTAVGAVETAFALCYLPIIRLMLTGDVKRCKECKQLALTANAPAHKSTCSINPCNIPDAQ